MEEQPEGLFDAEPYDKKAAAEAGAAENAAATKARVEAGNRAKDAEYQTEVEQRDRGVDARAARIIAGVEAADADVNDNVSPVYIDQTRKPKATVARVDAELQQEKIQAEARAAEARARIEAAAPQRAADAAAVQKGADLARDELRKNRQKP